ncbi:alpha-glucoside-specific PTS transporter subunit IIBC [Streptococcus halotolerans]|uniref:alpha-glucoside-specific PTS transporter subunit IIBC n=1 Tax=Streptococcus halotolerans TaxID=1814128 RepID=UPI000788CED3|nr:alpha-glucoside-specific PTS transporter subunit IIBC [Streptococcus halotolerans]
MMEKFQRFGGAMFTPVLLFSFAGIMVSIATVANNELFVGGLAAEGTLWHLFWKIVENGSWTVFNNMELLFVIGLPIALARKANARAIMETVVSYLTLNYFINTILTYKDKAFGVDFSQDPGGISGLKAIAGIKTLDTGIIGAILIASIVIYLHNRYFEKSLPEFLGTFQGSSFVVMIAFAILLPLAFLICLIWPKVQLGISSLQVVMASSGVVGVWIYTFLERILIPTGLHHFVYTPFVFGPAVVEGGITQYWFSHLNEFAASKESLKTLFPEGGFALHGNSKVFASPGIAAAFYYTARPENRKKVLAMMIPVTLTAVLAGITEPLEFTFLFVAPPLFAVHAVLAAFLAATLYFFGVTGDYGGGLIDFVTRGWIPMFANHSATVFTHILVGLIYTVIWFLVFRFLIMKFNVMTPGRAVDPNAEMKLYSKQDYKDKKGSTSTNANTDSPKSSAYLERAAAFLEAVGGVENINSVTNCATRLRLTVKDEGLVQDDSVFRASGAHGLVKKGNNIQIIVGLDVPQVREEFDNLVKYSKDNL